MKTIGNIFWFIVTGFVSGLIYFIFGVLLCITIIGIPFGKQFFKLARLVFWPFGKTINTNFVKHPITNVIWLILGGLVAAFWFFVTGLFWCITIIGIPFGKQCFKLAKLTFSPLGATID